MSRRKREREFFETQTIRRALVTYRYSQTSWTLLVTFEWIVWVRS